MHIYNGLLHEDMPIVGTIPPGAKAPATYLTEAIDFSLMHQLMAIVSSGNVLGTTPTIDFQFLSSATAAGTYAAIDATWKITQITTAAQVATLLIRAEAMPMKGANRFIKGQLVVGGTGNSEAGVIVLAGDLRYSPGQGQAVVVQPTYVSNFFFRNP